MKLNSNLKTESDSQSEIFIQSSYSFSKNTDYFDKNKHTVWNCIWTLDKYY